MMRMHQFGLQTFIELLFQITVDLFGFGFYKRERGVDFGRSREQLTGSAMFLFRNGDLGIGRRHFFVGFRIIFAFLEKIMSRN